VRRLVATAVALFCVLIQLALGVSSTLGLVFCVGDDHAGIELAAADCCAAHGTDSRPVVAAGADDCCSDIPLFTAVRPLSDVPRWQAAFAELAAMAAPAVVIARAGAAGTLPAFAVSPPPAALSRRSVVLRV
jgi:hypothetical protein